MLFYKFAYGTLFLNAVMCMTDVFSCAMASGFSQGADYLRLWTAYLDYLRRLVHWNEGIHTTQLICNCRIRGILLTSSALRHIQTDVTKLN